MAVELLCVHRIHHPQQHLPSPLVRKSMMHHLKPKIQSRRAVLASSHFNMANQLAAAAAEPQLTWEIAAGALAGVAPFVIAGIEFSKRIIAQKRCKLCGGSGLVKRDQYYFRCNGCGGFLPWQSWRRFFSG
ncbi:hypothetical protein O6H91_01G021300 [Diphasiastrum complanatum]|uniref:Uncharacterized protein n=1 Tax=Diphasiastrum complanatum TaxID=34168 RepID=A0ACC2ENW9_DIPCM|nr:hypothetical protein O6H91_01G021300 [Diphasiastrum complanatum]